MRLALLSLLLAAVAMAQEHGKASPQVEAGNAKLRAQDFAGALKDFAKVIQAEPKAPAGYIGRGRARLGLGEEEQAIADFTKAIELGAKGAYALRAQARIARFDFEGALADFDALLAANPYNPGAHMGRGGVHERLGNWKAAAADYQAVTEQGGAEWSVSWTQLAMAKFNLGDTKGALSAFEIAIYCNGSDPSIYLSRGRVYLREGKLAEARKDFDRAVEVAPDDTRALFGRARFHLDRGDPEEARSGLEKLVDRFPDEEYARLYLSLVRARLGEKEKAASELAAYLDKRENKDDWFTKVAGFLAGRLSEKDLFAAAKSDRPHRTREQECEAYWYAAALRLAAGEKDKAKEYLEKCVATNAQDFIEYDSAVMELKRLNAQ